MNEPSSTDSNTTRAHVSVVIVDDHALLRAGLRRLIDESSNFRVVSEASTLAEALEVAETKRPDIILLDITLGRDNALESLPDIIRLSRGAQVLVLSMHDEVEYVHAAFAAGADGYLIKDSAEGELLKALEALQRGERYVHPALGALLASAASDKPNDSLSDREREIARLLALGHTNQDIANQLFLSARTIETHRSHIMTKLRLQSRADLVQWALNSALIGKDN